MPVTDVCIAEEMIRRGDRDAVPLLRASVDALYSSEQLGYWLWGTGVLVEALWKAAPTAMLQEAEAAVERLSTQPVLDGWAWRDLILLRLQALLARTRGDEVAYRDFADRYRAHGDIAWLRRTHRDRRGDDMTAVVMR